MTGVPLEHKLHILPSLAAGPSVLRLEASIPQELNAGGPLPVGQEQFGSIWRKSRGPRSRTSGRSRSLVRWEACWSPGAERYYTPQEAGRAQGLPPLLHPSCPLHPGRGGEHHPFAGRAQDSLERGWAPCAPKRLRPPTRPQRGGTLSRMTSSAQDSCPPLPSFPQCGQSSVFTGTQSLSPRSLPCPRNSCLCLSPFPRAHAQSEPRAHIPGLAGAPVSCAETRDGCELHHLSPEPASLIFLPQPHPGL